MHVLNKSLFAACLLLFLVGQGQADTCGLRLSLLTCGPGTDLYSIWGHTGIRVIDTLHRKDVVFNYGTFDDSDPLFYLKFTRGIMLYSVAPYTFPDFMEEYRMEKRRVTEQVLNLDCAKKRKLANALWMNAKPENKFYPYHFYADNCTTRAADMLIRNIDTLIQFPNIRPQPGHTTYRQLIHSYMNNSAQAWNRLAIDILLGNHLDEAITNRQAMFLPDYLMKAFDSARLHDQPLLLETNTLLSAETATPVVFFTPAAIFLLVLAAMLLLTFAKNKTARKTAAALDLLFFMLTGFFGVLMLSLWMFRVDTVCRNNYNLLWALPTHLVMAFFLNSRRQWVRYYWLFTAILNALLLISWVWLPQEMNSSVLLAVVILLFRSVAHYRKATSI